MKKILFVLVICFGGCICPRPKPPLPKPETPQTTIVEVVKTEILYKNLGIVQGMLIVAATAGLIICFLKMPTIGIPIFLGCSGGLCLVAAVSNESLRYMMGIGSVVIGVGGIGYAIFMNRKVITEIVAGGEKFKKELSNEESLLKFKDSHNLTQNKFTKKIVDKIQKKINGKVNT